VSHDPSRKQFFAQVLGLTAAVGVLSKVGAKSTQGFPAAAPVVPVKVVPEIRAVSRDVNAA
jgi:hypothetical protein